VAAPRPLLRPTRPRGCRRLRPKSAGRLSSWPPDSVRHRSRPDGVADSRPLRARVPGPGLPVDPGLPAPRRAPISPVNQLQQTFFSEILDAHEVAHQWWGNVVAPASNQDTWLMEALANYSALLYLEKRKGPRRWTRYWPIQPEAARHGGGRPHGGIHGTDRVGPAPGHLGGAGRLGDHHLREGLVDHAHAAAAAGRRALPGHARRTGQALPAIHLEHGAVPRAGRRVLAPGSPDPTLAAFFENWVYATGSRRSRCPTR